MNIQNAEKDRKTKNGVDGPDLFCRHHTGLLWQLNMENRRLTLLNNEEVAGLEGSVEDLLQNLVKAQEMVVKEDFFRFKLFIKSLREGSEAAVIFRTRCSRGLRHWLKAAGAPAGGGSLLYYGYIRDITEDVDLINHMLEKDLERRVMIQHDEHPVILVDMESKSIISRNTYAYRLFEYGFDEFNRLKFTDLFPEEQKTRVSELYEACLLEGKWTGELFLLKKGNRRFEAEVNVIRLSVREKNLLKISIYETGRRVMDTGDDSLPHPEIFSQKLTAAVEEKNTMDDILDTLLKHQYGDTLFDAVMFVDPHIKKGKVYVYGRGETFATLRPGTSFDYEGITQFIPEDQPEFLMVKDTMESIKPVDWALFIPFGIRSYFARPFFYGTRLKALLILCSTQVNRFSEKEKSVYELYYPAFLKGLKNWKQRKK